MKKFKYAELVQKDHNGNWRFFLDGKLLTDNEYQNMNLMEALNYIGEDGWQVVTTFSDEHFIVMNVYYDE